MKGGFVLDDSLDRSDGVQQYVLTLGNWLTQQGEEVHYLVGQSQRTDKKFVHSLSRVIKVRFNQNNLAIPLPVRQSKMRQFLQSERFDILHVQMPYSPMLAGQIIKAMPPSTGLVGTFHVVPFSWVENIGAKLLALGTRHGLKRFDEVWSVSEPAAEFARRSFGLDSQILPNMIDLSCFKTSRPGKPSAKPVFKIVFLGRLVKRKGCLELLRAIEYLKVHGQLSDKIRVVVGGSGPLFPELKAYCQTAGLAGVVEFRGFIDENKKPNFLAEADIAVFPSLGGESFGIVLLEAMAAGAGVVVAGNNVGYSSVLQADSRMLVDPTNSADFGRLLIKYFHNRDQAKVVHGDQQLLVKNYDVELVGPKILNGYCRVIAKRSPPRHNKH